MRTRITRQLQKGCFLQPFTLALKNNRNMLQFYRFKLDNSMILFPFSVSAYCTPGFGGSSASPSFLCRSTRKCCRLAAMHKTVLGPPGAARQVLLTMRKEWHETCPSPLQNNQSMAKPRGRPWSGSLPTLVSLVRRQPWNPPRKTNLFQLETTPSYTTLGKTLLCPTRAPARVPPAWVGVRWRVVWRRSGWRRSWKKWERSR